MTEVLDAEGRTGQDEVGMERHVGGPENGQWDEMDEDGREAGHSGLVLMQRKQASTPKTLT
jgi:hypothetical protein